MTKFKLDFNNIKVELELAGKYTILVGDSGTGKTFLFNTIVNIKGDPILKKKCKSNINIDNIEICLNKREVSNIYSCNNMLIFIDRYDMLCMDYDKDELNQKLIDFLNTSNNIFVVANKHELKGVWTPMRSYYTLENKVEGENIYLYNKLF